LNEGEEFGERDVEEIDFFVEFGLGDSGFEVFGEVDLHGLGDEAGTGKVADEAGPFAGAEAGLFDELAFGGGEGSFAGIDGAGGEFEEILGGGVAVLALDEDEGVGGIRGGVDGEDDDGAIVADDVAGSGDAVGFGDFVGGDGEDFSFEGYLRGEDDGFFGVCLGSFGWGGFGL